MDREFLVGDVWEMHVTDEAGKTVCRLRFSAEDCDLSVPKTRFGRIGDAVHRGQDMILGRQGAESDDAPARLC